MPLQLTKLNRPQPVKDILPRDRLLVQLGQGRGCNLTLVSAPAGYGKTTLISRWLETLDRPSAWVSLDESENDPRLFIRYIIRAAESIHPAVCQATRALIISPELPPVRAIIETLTNDLIAAPSNFILALDDYYRISNQAIHDLINGLLAYPTENIHLVIISRFDPPLNLSSLRAGGQMTEIRTHDLRFTVPETAAFLEKITGMELEPVLVEKVAAKYEGWVTGMRLLVLALKRHGHLELLLEDIPADNQYAREYLFYEVLDQLPTKERKMLMYTALFERFCAPLCEALDTVDAETKATAINGWDFINSIRKRNLFVVSLDTENQWYRYHHIFQKLLVNQLQRHFPPKAVNAVHRRASAWFAENGLIDEAIRYALASGDVDGAAQFVEQNRLTLLNAERWYVLEKWLSRLPDTVIQRRPELLLAQVWIQYFHFRLTRIPSLLDVAESLLSHKPKEKLLYGEIYLFRGVCCFLQGDGAPSLKYIEDALERIPTTYHMIRGFAESYFGFAGQMHGQTERILDVLSGLIHHRSLHDARKVRVMLSLVGVHMVSGSLALAATLNQQLKNFATRIESITNAALSSWFQGVIHFCRNELDMAIECFSQAAEACFIFPKRVSVDCLAGLALAYQATQQTDKVSATMARLLEYIHSSKDSTFLEVAHSCRARLSLMKGEAPFASDLPGIDTASGGRSLFIFLEIPGITQCRVLLAEGSDTSLREAEKRLQALLRLSQAQHNTLQMIGIMVLQALALQKQGRTDEALAALETAVELARPGGFIRPFVESGPTVEGLLKRLAEKDVAVDYIGQLLDAFKADQNGVKRGTFEPLAGGRPSVSNQPLIAPLSHRELDILDLLARRQRNKEIAAQLFISPETVKKHLYNIYRKLGVNKRRQAVAKAEAMGIIAKKSGFGF
jgi:LuxR family maltose regulon positive regulatory protein